MSVIENLLRWTPFVIFQKYSSPFLIKYRSKGICNLLYGGLRRYEARKITKIEEFWLNKYWTWEKWQPHSDKKSTKMKGLLRPQIFYAPVSKCVQSIWKQYRPLGTVLCFSRWSRKRTPTASQKQKQIGLKMLYFFLTNFQYKRFLASSQSIAFAGSSRYYESGKNVFCLGIPTTIKFKQISVIRNLLRWTPFHILQTYSSPFFDQILFKKYLQSVIWGFAALWGQKYYKDRRTLMK